MASRPKVVADEYLDEKQKEVDWANLTQEEFNNAPVELTDDDLLADLELRSEDEQPESDAEIMRELNAYDPADNVAASEPAAPVDDWLADVRELARKHGPFSAAQILQMVRELNPADGAGTAR